MMKRYKIYYKELNAYIDNRSFSSKSYAIKIMNRLYASSDFKFSDFELKEVDVNEGVVLTDKQKEIIRNSMEYELMTSSGELEDDIKREMREILEILK